MTLPLNTISLTGLVVLAGHFLLHATPAGAAPPAAPIGIQVVDAETSRGIPQVILESSLGTRHVTDNHGLVAFDEPIARHQDVFFKPTSDGYSFSAPGLAMGGAVLKAEPGSSATLVMQREMIAQRLYRITGAGLYKDTLALGHSAPIDEPLINAGVLGQDSALCALYGGRQFWIWGDTGRFGHPLRANFRATGAFSDLPTSGGLPAATGINLHYLQNDGTVKAMVPLRPDDRSAVYWLTALMNVPDDDGRERLLAWYNRITMPGMVTVERGLLEYDPKREEFAEVLDYPTTAPLQPAGHAVRHHDYIYFTGGELMRVPATYRAATNPAAYEALTCLASDGAFSTATARIARDAHGRVEYRWRAGAAPTGPGQQRELVEAGLMTEDECLFRPYDAATGQPFRPHGSHTVYHPARRKWIMITSELGGTSMLGEAWYLEADAPEGPWHRAVKVLTHAGYSFYNPLIHAEYFTHSTAEDAQRFLYFEGTYTKMFSGVEVPTPYYDYNQVMYRVDLDDARLAPLHADAPSTGSQRFVVIDSANR